jgi:DNA-binding LacI/PurR family transcriptional regulator
VARRLGLSQSTISRAFSEGASIHPKTRELVIEAAKSLGYQPNIIARSLILRRTNIIAVVMANLTDPFYSTVLEQLALRIQSAGRQVLFFMIPPGKQVDDLLPSLLQYRVDAILIASATISSRTAGVCMAQRVPVVLFNRYVPGLRVAAICCDNAAGGRVVADLLWKTGHRRPAFVSGESDVTTNRDRFLGYSRRLNELGLPLHAHLTGGEFSYSAGYRAAQSAISSAKRPDSIFFASDIMAIGGIEAIRAAGLRVPDDISVVGFDDVPGASWPAYNLTTVRQPIEAMVGNAAGALGLNTPEIIKPSRKTLRLPVELIERGTVSKGRSA